MKICYPFKDINGQDFRSLDEVMRLVNGEAHGSWLLGANGLWHGGIHISDISNPFSALNPDALNTGEPVPLQFMANGTLVAYRLNRDYLTAPYCGKQLRYSSSFVLVKSQCKPDPEKPASWLDFYALYMHLAPLTDYPICPCYKVKTGHNGITLRKKIHGQNGLPEGQDDKGEFATYAATAKTNQRLNEGERVVCSRTGRFYAIKNGQMSLMPFGLVHLFSKGRLGKEQYWVTLDAELMERDGEITSLVPEWMVKAEEKGIIDKVVVTPETNDWKVDAGTSVGFMGCMETPGEDALHVDKEWFVHLEVFSPDANMPKFLSNPASIKGKKWTVRAPKGTLLHIRSHSDQKEFVATPTTLGAQCWVRGDAVTSTYDGAKKKWYHISGSGWLPKDDVEEIGQYDFLKQGFMPLEDSGGDMMDSPFERWVSQAFGEISRAAERGNYLYLRVPPFYRELIEKINGNRDGKVSADEVRQALTVRDPLVQEVVNRLVVKHHSEWFGGRSTGRWEGFYKSLESFEKAYCEKWQADMEWMSQVAPFNKGVPVWHFHPVVFLNALEHVSCDCEKLYADKFKVTRYGKVFGPIYKGTMSLKDYPRWDILIAKGKLTVDEKDILIAMSENEGNMDAIQSYDSEVITAGAMQKTVKDKKKFEGKGELSTQFAKFRDLHPELYNRYVENCGWSVEGSGPSAVMYYKNDVLTQGQKITSKDLKVLIRTGSSLETYGKTVYHKPLAALLKIVTLAEYLDLQVLDFIERLHEAEEKNVNANFSIKDFVKNKFGRAVILDHSVNRPNFVQTDFRAAVDRFFINHPTTDRNPKNWRDEFDENENKLLNEYKITRNMTDSTSRFNTLKVKLCKYQR